MSDDTEDPKIERVFSELEVDESGLSVSLYEEYSDDDVVLADEYWVGAAAVMAAADSTDHKDSIEQLLETDVSET